MDKKEKNLWSTSPGNAYLAGIHFDLSDSIKTGSEGERRNSRAGQLQKALVVLLQTGELPKATSKKEEPVKAPELRFAILSKAKSLLDTHPKFSQIAKEDRTKILAIAIKDLPAYILPENDSPIGLKDGFTAPSKGQTTKPAAATTANLPEKTPAQPNPIEPLAIEEEAPTAPREFIISGNETNLEELDISFAGENIYLDDPDQRLMLATILVRAATDPKSEISKVAIFNSVGGAKRAAPLFIEMKQAMEEQAYGSSATLTPTKKGERMHVTVPIKNDDIKPRISSDNNATAEQAIELGSGPA